MCVCFIDMCVSTFECVYVYVCVLWRPCRWCFAAAYRTMCVYVRVCAYRYVCVPV